MSSPGICTHLSDLAAGGEWVQNPENCVPGDDNKCDPDMDYIGCLGSNGQHSQILPFRVTFIVVTLYNATPRHARGVQRSVSLHKNRRDARARHGRTGDGSPKSGSTYVLPCDPATSRDSTLPGNLLGFPFNILQKG